MRTLRIYFAALLALTAGACGRKSDDAAKRQNIVYGIDADSYRLETAEVGKGETMSKILNGYGITVRQIDQLDRASKQVFPLSSFGTALYVCWGVHKNLLHA